MSEPAPPWDDLDELLDAEREVPAIGRAATTRMATRLAAALPVGAMGPGASGAGGGGAGGGGAGGGGGAPTGGADGGPAIGTSLPPGAGAIGAAVSAGGISSTLATIKLGLGLAIFGVGAAVGAAGHATWTSTRSEAVSSAPASPAAAPSPPAPPASPPLTEPEVAASSVSSDPAGPDPSGRAAPPARPQVSAEPTSSPRTDEALRSERTLIERARTAITRDDPAAALDALRAHRARFPRGELAEERDALEVRALRMRGDEDAARDAARRFRDEHPDSMLGD